MKEQIRKEMLGRLRDLPSQNRIRMEQELTTAVCSSEEWHDAKTIGVTWSNFPEIDTHKIIQKGLEEGKRMVVPYSGKNRIMTFHEYLPDTAMARSRFGIMEPVDKRKPGTVRRNRSAACSRIGIFGNGLPHRVRRRLLRPLSGCIQRAHLVCAVPIPIVQGSSLGNRGI